MKKSTMKKLLVAMLSLAMVFAMAACGGGGSSSEGEEASSGAAGALKIFNSKMEIQDVFESDLASAYEAEAGVPVEVYYSSDTVAAHLSTKYASNDPYAVNMVDAKDIYSLAAEYGADMSDMDWVKDTNYAIDVDGKVLGYPVCVEARGIIYNATAIENVLGEKFDPASIKTLDDFKAICDKLVAAGMETPTSIMKEDWSLAGHFLAQVYEEREDVDGFVASLKSGDAKLIEDAKFNALMDTFDVLKEYNMWKGQEGSAERELSEQALAEGKIAFMFGGNWDFAMMKDFDYIGGAGMMPVPQNVEDDYTGKLVGGGSKYFYVDASEGTSEETTQAAKDFLAWFASSDTAHKFVSETCGMVSPFGSNTVTCTDDLGASVKGFADADMLVPNFNGLPDDHYSICGAEMQKYLAGQCTREELATAVENYWKAQA